MTDFTGFPERMQYTSLPSAFFSELLPQIDDVAELKTTLYLVAALCRQRGYPRFVALSQLQADVSLMRALKNSGTEPVTALEEALAAAVARGTVLHLKITRAGKPDDIYLLNTATDREALARLTSGELSLPEVEIVAPEPAAAETPPDIFVLYEQNIGMLTPMIAEELKAAEATYPPEWIADAVREAVSHNKRKWSYIAAILERWQREGRGRGTDRRDSKEDPDKYIRGKYGHMVRRS